MTISRSLTDAPKARLTFKLPQNDKPRTLCIVGHLTAILRSHRAAQAAERLALGGAYEDGDLVFARSDGKPIPPWSFGAPFASLMKRAAVRRIRFHDLRDTHASLLARAGVPIEVVSQPPRPQHDLDHGSTGTLRSTGSGMRRPRMPLIDSSADAAFRNP